MPGPFHADPMSKPDHAQPIISLLQQITSLAHSQHMPRPSNHLSSPCTAQSLPKQSRVQPTATTDHAQTSSCQAQPMPSQECRAQQMLRTAHTPTSSCPSQPMPRQSQVQPRPCKSQHIHSTIPAHAKTSQYPTQHMPYPVQDQPSPAQPSQWSEQYMASHAHTQHSPCSA